MWTWILTGLLIFIVIKRMMYDREQGNTKW